MNKHSTPLAALAVLTAALTVCTSPAAASQSIPVATAAETAQVTETTAAILYGIMQIPYDRFFLAEGAEAVDAVSSATAQKWKSDSFAAGAYYEAHTEDAGGTILGAVYPVAIDEETLAALGDQNFGFTPLDSVPAAYKTVSVSGGTVQFSQVQGARNTLSATAVLKTDTVWGDYQIDIDAINNKNGTSDIGTVSGVLLQCSDGSVYAMRHLENIWLDELSWSSGVRTVEPHGNVMNSEMYADMMGKTITEITYITDSGYYVIPVELYVPVKFVGGVSAENAAARSGHTTIAFENLPSDYAVSASVAGLNAQLDGMTLSFADALPGAYTLAVSDTAGKYANLTAAFVLTTDALPVTFDADANALVAADNSNAELAEAFLSNITSVIVNDTTYAASGRGAVAIVDRSGAVDLEAVLVKGKGAEAVSTPIFTAGESYRIAVQAAGFPELVFALTVK